MPIRGNQRTIVRLEYNNQMAGPRGREAAKPRLVAARVLAAAL